jgi:hypothetical protein
VERRPCAHQPQRLQAHPLSAVVHFPVSSSQFFVALVPFQLQESHQSASIFRVTHQFGRMMHGFHRQDWYKRVRRSGDLDELARSPTIVEITTAALQPGNHVNGQPAFISCTVVLPLSIHLAKLVGEYVLVGCAGRIQIVRSNTAGTCDAARNARAIRITLMRDTWQSRPPSPDQGINYMSSKAWSADPGGWALCTCGNSAIWRPRRDSNARHAV